MNEASGHEEWFHQTEGFSWLVPSVADGIVYVADSDKLDAIQPPAVTA